MTIRVAHRGISLVRSCCCVRELVSVASVGFCWSGRYLARRHCRSLRTALCAVRVCPRLRGRGRVDSRQRDSHARRTRLGKVAVGASALCCDLRWQQIGESVVGGLFCWLRLMGGEAGREAVRCVRVDSNAPRRDDQHSPCPPCSSAGCFLLLTLGWKIVGVRLYSAVTGNAVNPLSPPADGLLFAILRFSPGRAYRTVTNWILGLANSGGQYTSVATVLYPGHSVNEYVVDAAFSGQPVPAYLHESIALVVLLLWGVVNIDSNTSMSRHAAARVDAPGGRGRRPCETVRRHCRAWMR